MNKKNRMAIAAMTAAALALIPAMPGLANTLSELPGSRAVNNRPVDKAPGKPVEKDPIRLPVEAPPSDQAPGRLVVSGELKYETELESPHYVVDGWALQFESPELLAHFVGQQVVIQGTQFDGMSILMRKQIVVDKVSVTLEGELKQVTDLSTPHFELDGIVITGEQNRLEAVANTTVKLRGTLVTGPSIFMKPVVEVLDIATIDKADQTDTRTVKGVLKLEKELESPHYVVDGWVLLLEDQYLLNLLVDKEITVKGREFDGVSIFMRPQLEVEEISLELKGQLTRVTNAGPAHFDLGGWVILGDTADLNRLAGSEVTLKGTVHMGPSVYFKPVLMLVETATAPAPKPEPAPAPAPVKVQLPSRVVVGGKALSFVQGPILLDGQLMLPVRAIVEAAGGTITWDGKAQAVEAKIGEQSALVTIGQFVAGKGKVLTKAPVLHNSHTLVPLEFFSLLGLDAQWEGDVLTLIPGRSR